MANPLFATLDFRSYLRTVAEVRGRGEFRRIADALKMHTTLVSQILNGKKCFTEEQASNLCVYLSLNPLETDYFLKLVQIERAGNESLKKTFQRHLQQIMAQAKETKSRVPESQDLTEQDRAIYYSSWQYSLVRLLTSIDGLQTFEKISDYLRLPASRVREILDFLVSRNLCKEGKKGKYERTGKNTHVEARSPLAIRHHQNWRSKSHEFQERMTDADLAFTAPISVSSADRQRIRSLLLDTISQIAKIVETSPAEEVVYLGIDWLKIGSETF